MKQKTDFGRKVRNYMEEFAPPLLTEADLSNALKETFPERTYYQKNISYYFIGKQDPPLDFVEKCAALFKLDGKQVFELLALALRSSKEVKIDCTKLTFIPETIVKLLALILSGKVLALSDEECDKIIADNKFFIDISSTQEFRIPQLKMIVADLSNSFINKP
ncbi:hypothetical protein AGMMS49579_23120 [Spirochaetia bacterium]|nr:hypothetical protein AGMMS49579_23120 [Spirochaetia bacterium]